MNLKFYIGLLLPLLIAVSTGQTHKSGISGPAAYNQGDVISDPENGNSIVCNQLQIIFKENINENQRISAVKSVNGAIEGYLQDLNIYQIGIPNLKCDFAELKRVREKLAGHRSVYQVSYRSVAGSGLQEIDVGKLKTKRQGQLDLQPAVRKQEEKPSEMELILTKNKATLHGCTQQFPGVHGQVEFRMVINPDGNIKEVQVLQSTVENKKLTECMKYKVGKWNDFPQEPKGFDRNLEFSFKF